MTEPIWQDPPTTPQSPREVRTDSDVFADHLRANPGRWAILPGHEKQEYVNGRWRPIPGTPSLYTSGTARNIALGVSKAFRPQGAFEATFVKDVTATAARGTTLAPLGQIYVRFVGANSAPEETP